MSDGGVKRVDLLAARAGYYDIDEAINPIFEARAFKEGYCQALSDAARVCKLPTLNAPALILALAEIEIEDDVEIEPDEEAPDESRS